MKLRDLDIFTRSFKKGCNCCSSNAATRKKFVAATGKKIVLYKYFSTFIVCNICCNTMVKEQYKSAFDCYYNHLLYFQYQVSFNCIAEHIQEACLFSVRIEPYSKRNKYRHPYKFAVIIKNVRESKGKRCVKVRQRRHQSSKRFVVAAEDHSGFRRQSALQ
ncbi:uncharacterized protein LOC112494953 [Cephus cinctus]|uniref:Uncharacterized protein LOC112494953 n=1 Tax=Cephus cinctus TaxID=211228 RepID=A0AAJ7W4Y7_CEPCN|nr:uncharacterized protein LOC112494953 [Cephus cinctus]